MLSQFHNNWGHVLKMLVQTVWAVILLVVVNSTQAKAEK